MEYTTGYSTGYTMEDTKKRLPLLWALGISVVAVLAINVLYFLFLKNDGTLTQIAIIASLFAVCLPGILTRSKLKAAANVLVAPLAWLPALFGIDSPWGLATNLRALVNDLLDEMLRPNLDFTKSDIDEIKPYTDYMILFDLILILFLALVFGFFCAMVATGFFHKDGSFAQITIISKPLALLMLLILLPIPIAYHGVMKTGESVVSLAAGAMVVADTAAYMENASTETIPEVTEGFEDAQGYFDISRKAFAQAQKNFLFMIIMNQIGTYEVQEGVPVEEYIDIADAMLNGLYYFTGASPSLYGGIASLMDGLNYTFDGMGMETASSATMTSQSVGSVSQSSSLDPYTFAQGIAYLRQSIGNFTFAEEDLKKAWAEVESIFETNAFQQLVEGDDEETADTLRALKAIDKLFDRHIASNMANGTIYFVQAAFAVMSAIEDLGNNQFISARNHLVHASGNFTIATDVFNEVLTDFPAALAESEITQPIWGGVKALANMTTLIVHFTNAAINGTDGIIAVNNTAQILANMNITAALENPDLQDFFDAGANLDWASANITGASFNIGLASQTSADIKTEDYGEALDTPMTDFATELEIQLGIDNTTGFWGNVTDFGHMLRALSHTLYAMQDYTRGFNYFDQAFVEFQGSGNTTEYFANLTFSSYWLGLSRENASDGVLVFADFGFPIETAYPGKANMHMDPGTEDTVENANRDIHAAASLSKAFVDWAAADNGTAADFYGNATEGVNGTVSLVAIAQVFLSQVFGGGGGGAALKASLTTVIPHREVISQYISNPSVKGLKKQLNSAETLFVPFFLGIAFLAILARIRRKD
ncbi:MAG: hypothetical protein ACFFB3_04075 [Candidatus Hodarchaeota archaeon]